MRFFHTETKLAEFLLQASILHKPRESESPQSGMPIPQRAKPNNHHATEPAIRRRRGDANRNRPLPQAGSSGAGKAKRPSGAAGYLPELKPTTTTSSRMNRSVTPRRGDRGRAGRGEGAHRAVRVRAGDRIGPASRMDWGMEWGAEWGGETMGALLLLYRRAVAVQCVSLATNCLLAPAAILSDSRGFCAKPTRAGGRSARPKARG